MPPSRIRPVPRNPSPGSIRSIDAVPEPGPSGGSTLSIEAREEDTFDDESTDEEHQGFLIIHHVTCNAKTPGHREHTNKSYYDQPRLFRGDSGGSALRGTRPMRSVQAYHRAHPDVGFLVQRQYDCEAYHFDMSSLFERLPLPRADPSVPPQVFPYFDIIRETCPLAEPLREFVEVLGPCRAQLQSMAADEPLLLDWEHHLSPPYLPFYHMRSTIDHLAHDHSTDSANSHVERLLGYMREHLNDDWAEADRLLQNGQVTKTHLSKLFQPGEAIITWAADEPLAWISKEYPRSFRSQRDADSLSISCFTWSYDGEFYKEHEDLDMTWPLVDKEPCNIPDLEMFPLRFDTSGLREALMERGTMFWSCRNQKLVEYHAPPTLDARQVAPRYMIDIKSYHELHPKDETAGPRDYHKKRPENAATPSDELFILALPPVIKGFGMHDKKWRTLVVRFFKEVKWDDRMFKHLVLDQQKKDLIEATVQVHMNKKMTSDIMEGKGNGLILLLHGGPGTGKTLTAESIAELARKPLYRVTCGDIGTDPESVEEYLNPALHVGNTWQAVVLLDESDIFLEEREKFDLQRNALVSVFLRVLEYYDGILILTSNRVGTFDEAFKSRVQLALHYPPLDTKGREKIWNNFIKMLKHPRSSEEPPQTGDAMYPEEVDIEDLLENLNLLASQNLNGRQIRNALTTARQLAMFRRQPLSFRHLEQTIGAIVDFEGYIQKTRGQSEASLAREGGRRAE